MDNKILSLLGLCQRAGRLSSGELSCEIAVREKKAKIIILAEDASGNTNKKFNNSASYYKIKLFVKGTKKELGMALGKESRAVIAVTDEGFAKKITELLETCE